MQKLLIIAASLLVAFVAADEVAPVVNDNAVDAAPRRPHHPNHRSRPTPEQIAARDAEMKAKCIEKLGEEKCNIKFEKMEEMRARHLDRKNRPPRPEAMDIQQQKHQRSNPHRPRATTGRRQPMPRAAPPTDKQ